VELDGALRDLATVRSEYRVSGSRRAGFPGKAAGSCSRSGRRRIAVFDALTLNELALLTVGI